MVFPDVRHNRGKSMRDLDERLAALGPYPQHLSDLLAMGHEIATLGGLYVEQNAWLLARLALYNELAQAGEVRLVRHADDCCTLVYPLRNPSRCTCGRDALLAKLEVPR